MNREVVELPFPEYAACSTQKALDHSYINYDNIAKSALTELVQKATLNSNKVPDILKIPDIVKKEYTKEEKAKFKYYCPSPQHIGDHRVSKLHRVHVGESRVNIIKHVLQSKITEDIAEKVSLCFMNCDELPTFNDIIRSVLWPAVQNVLKNHGEFSVMLACPNCNHSCDNDKHPNKNFIAVKKN